jgi:hypothetical protein
MVLCGVACECLEAMRRGESYLVSDNGRGGPEGDCERVKEIAHVNAGAQRSGYDRYSFVASVPAIDKPRDLRRNLTGRSNRRQLYVFVCTSVHSWYPQMSTPP